MLNRLIILAQGGGQTPPASTPGQGAPSGPAPFLIQMVPILLLFAVFYLLLIRPQQKQRKEHQKLLTELKSGDKVVTSAGIHGTITNVKDKTFVVRIADGVKIEIDKSSVGRVTERGSGDDSERSK
jgi:preprotein translocase subunit YajC